MNLEIKSLGQTLAIGVLALVTLRILIRLHFPRTETSREEPGSQTMLKGAFYVAIAFAFGIMAEDFSRSVVGKPPPGLLKRVWPKDILLASHQVTRTSCLFTLGQTNGSNRKIKGVEAIGRDLARHHLISFYGGEHGPLVEERIVSQGPLPTFEQASAVATALYYQAKNILYQHPSYYQDLSTISLKVDFARSLCFVCAGLLVLLVVLIGFDILVGGTVWGARRLNPYLGTTSVIRNFRGRIQHWAPSLDDYSFKVSERHFGFACVLAAGIWIGASTYESEEFNFNARVFGTWDSIHTDGFRGSFSPDTNVLQRVKSTASPTKSLPQSR